MINNEMLSSSSSNNAIERSKRSAILATHYGNIVLGGDDNNCSCNDMYVLGRNKMIVFGCRNSENIYYITWISGWFIDCKVNIDIVSSIFGDGMESSHSYYFDGNQNLDF